MANKYIRYSQNWNNKLDNWVYTSIRKHNDYFEHSQIYDALLQDKFYHTAQLLHKGVYKGIDIPEVRWWTDTGMSEAESIKIICSMHKVTIQEYYSNLWDVLYFKRLDAKNCTIKPPLG